MRKERFFKKVVFTLVILILLLITTNNTNAKLTKFMDPPTPMQDQIIHNKGNIATSIQNWGQIGGQSHLGIPSGEWPKGSEHNYLAEIKYWMGAITSSGDTVVANSEDDFMPISIPLAGEQSYKIRLSTDPETYNYDPSDTAGLGVGKPAYGWSIWDSQTESWVYNRVWNSQESLYVEAGPVSLQESHYRFNDANSGISILGLELTQTIYQWNYSYNEDFLFVVLEIKNKSSFD